MKFIPIDDIDTQEKVIPNGFKLIIYEKGTKPEEGSILYSFDEINEWKSKFNNPAIGFINVFR